MASNTYQSDFLSSGGEMEKLIRTFDWAATSLGPIEQWPQCLKSAVSIVLQSDVPMILIWGKDGILIYNDAYSIFAGKRHPQLLGAKVVEGWPEVAEFNQNMLAGVLKGEKLSYHNQRLTLYRNDVAEDVWMNLHYSPVIDKSGKPAGALAIVFERTQEVLAAKKQQEAEDALKTERQRLRVLFMNAPAAVAILVGPDLVFQLANEPYKKLIGKDYPLEGKPLVEVLPEVEEELFGIIKKVAFKGERFTANELPVKLDWENSGKPYTRYLNFIYETYYENNEPNGLMAFAYDVTDQVQARMAVEDQNRVLEMVTSGESLEDALSFHIKSIEDQSYNNITGSILLLDDDGQHLRHGAAPNLPKEYNEAIDGTKIGPYAGSCGTAAYRKEVVVVSDIAKDPLWKDHKDLALAHGLRSCWSTPILSGNKVLGTLDIYYRENMVPSGQDKKLVDFAIRTARIVIERKAIEKELKEREEHLRALITSTSDFIYMMNADWSDMSILDGRIFMPETEKPLQNTAWLQEFIPEEEHSRVREEIENAIRTKSVFQLEHGVKRANGTTGWASSRAVPILNENGEIEKWFGAATDITARKQIQDSLKESEERFRSMADQSPMIVFMIEPNEEGSVSYWSRTWLEYTGQTFEQALGLSWHDVIHPDDISLLLDKYVSGFRSRSPYTIPAVRIKRHDGQYRWHLIKANPRHLPGGEFMGFVGVGIDIHDQKMALQELELKNKQLVRINNELDSFIYTASHDLKAPVSNIEGLVNTLTETLGNNGSQLQEQEVIMDMINKSISRFKNTLIDLTDISKAQKNIYENPEELNILEIINDVKETISDLVRETNAQINIDTKDCENVKLSKVNLKSIFYNLISNAVKYRSPDREPIVDVSCSTEDKYLLIEVSDNGLGIKEANKAKLFTMFKRFHDHVEGTGIGLYIVRKIIENAGGKIEVESEVGKGTTFKVYLKTI